MVAESCILVGSVNLVSGRAHEEDDRSPVLGRTQSLIRDKMRS